MMSSIWPLPWTTNQNLQMERCQRCLEWRAPIIQQVPSEAVIQPVPCDSQGPVSSERWPWTGSGQPIKICKRNDIINMAGSMNNQSDSAQGEVVVKMPYPTSMCQ